MHAIDVDKANPSLPLPGRIAQPRLWLTALDTSVGCWLLVACCLAMGCRESPPPATAAAPSKTIASQPSTPATDAASPAAPAVPAAPAEPPSVSATAPGGTAWIRQKGVLTLPDQPAPAPGPDGLALPTAPELAPLRQLLAAAQATTVGALAARGPIGLNPLLGALYPTTAEDDRGFLEAFATQPIKAGKPNVGAELWYVEGKFMGIFFRLKAGSGVPAALATWLGRPADLAGSAPGTGGRPTWVAGDTVYQAAKGKKFDTVLVAVRSAFVNWAELEAAAAAVGPNLTLAQKALTAQPIDLDTASTELTKALIQLPYHTRATAKLAKVAYLLGDYAEVIKVTDAALQIVRHVGTKEDLLYYRAMADVQQDRKMESIRRLKELVAASKSAPTAQARLNALLNKYDEATLKAAFIELRCLSHAHAIRGEQLAKEFPGMTVEVATERLEAMMSPDAWLQFDLKVGAQCGYGFDPAAEEAHLNADF